MDEELREKVKHIAYMFFTGKYNTKENVFEKGRKLRYGIFLNNRLVEGMSEETYNKYKDSIDAIFSDKKREREEINARENWVVKALSGNIIRQVTQGEDFSIYTLTTRIPSDIWAKIKDYAEYISSDEEMEGGEDLFTGETFRGWSIAPKAGEILRQEAERIATQEQRELARQIIVEDEEAERERQRKKAEREELKLRIIKDGKQLISEFTDKKFYADWSWDDYSQKVGEIIKETNFWAVHRYLIDEKEVGVILKGKQKIISPADITTGKWGVSKSVKGLTDQMGLNLKQDIGGKVSKRGWFRHRPEHRDAYFKGQKDKALARRQFLGHGGKCSNRWVIQKRDTYKWNDYKVFLTRDGAEQFMRTHNKLKFRIFGE